MWRKIKKIIFYSLAIIIILMATLVTLIETQTGSRLVVQALAKHFGVEHGNISGNLRKGLDIEWIQYQSGLEDATTSIYARNISFRWNSIALLYTALSIESLSLDELKIRLPESQKKSTGPFSEWPSLGLPLRIELKKFQLHNIEYTQGNYQDRWQAFSGSISLGTFNLRYTPLKLVHEKYQLKLDGSSDLDYPYATAANLSWQFDADTHYAGKTQFSGGIKKLMTKTKMLEPMKANAEIMLPLVNAKKELQLTPEMDVSLVVEKQALPQAWWFAEKVSPVLDLKMQAKGNWQNYAGQINGNVALEGYPAVDLLLKAKGSWQKINVETLDLTESRQEIIDKPVSHLNVNGDIQWLPDLNWNLQANADAFDAALLVENWPTKINASLHSEGEKKPDHWLWKVDELKAEGTVRDLAFSIKGNLHQNQNEWRSNGLQIIWGANRIDVNGYLAEKSNVEWNLRAPILSQLDDNFSGSLTSKGSLSGSWSLPKITAQATGQDLGWKQFSLENLQLSFMPATNAGENKSPVVFNALGNDNPMKSEQDALVMGQYYRMDLLASKLRINQESFKSIHLSGEGSLLDHKMNASVRHDRLGKLDFSLDGKMLQEEWIGRMQSMAIKIKKVPKWWLSSRQLIKVNPHRVELQPLCFTTRSNQTAIIDPATMVAEDVKVSAPFFINASAARTGNKLFQQENQNPHSSIKVLHAPELCMNLDWQAATGLALNIDVNAVPLRQFYALFKPEVFFAGVMDGYLHIKSSQLDLASTQGDLLLETRDAELRYQYEGGVTEVYPWRFASISSRLDQGNLFSALKMDWSGFGNFAMENQWVLGNQSSIKGSLQGGFHNLEPLETLLPFTDNVKGKLSADLKWQGNLVQPQISGAIKLEDASARIPKLGVTLDKTGFLISADNSSEVNLEMFAHAGKGELNLQGKLINPLLKDWSFTANLHGNNFQIINVPSMKASLNPAINLTANSQMIKLTGEAEVPHLVANIKTLPQSVVQVSDDVVVVDEKNAALNQSKNQIPFSANLRLKLGDGVKFSGFGLDSQLSGDVKLIKEPLRPWLTNGFVGVKEGSYQAYGQELTIERGRLIFQGDYENPGLDINAYRNIDDDVNTKVILEISGSLQKPKAKVFSEPATSDSDAMMMLLTGKPLDEASKGDASMLIAALGGMGVERSQGITQEVAQFFGVDEVSIKSDKGIDQSQLWVGKYVTPKILVRYVVGLFDQAFSLGVVYRLTDKVRIEAESGETQSVDMIYKIER
jgi:translocation and assembly module TamB